MSATKNEPARRLLILCMPLCFGVGQAVAASSPPHHHTLLAQPLSTSLHGSHDPTLAPPVLPCAPPAPRFVLHVPKNLPLDAAAPLLCAGITAYSPLRYYGLVRGVGLGQ